MWHEKLRNHDLSKAILGEKLVLEDTNRLRDTIRLLEADPQKNDALWLNNLAGAHIRLNEPHAAVALLEPVIDKFPNDYGIHANLGTAYHMLGRYQDAEREIARDLEINPDAHFGLEKYHLALLQYLSRDAKYQARHVYVDEFTGGFLAGSGPFFPKTSISEEIVGGSSNNLAAVEADYAAMMETNKDNWRLPDMLATVVSMDPKPSYRAKWNLSDDANFEQGVIYMAQMNPKEPACFVMLGIAAWRTRNYNLAASAFEKAIDLGSPQSELLKGKVDGFRHYISESHKHALPGQIAMASIAVLILYYIYSKFRDRRRARRVGQVQSAQLGILLAIFFCLNAGACIWDAQSLSREKSRSHDLAQVILGEAPVVEDTNQLRATIKSLEANRNENDPNWWNNLAGAHIRLGESQVAVTLLEPVVQKFPNDYGIHANLGTAYHLLGRYQDAEKEIARDLEINPGAHFGLEKYHLALLQYLMRDQKYQARHVYVDEFTSAFLTAYRGALPRNGFDELYQSMGESYSNNVAAAEADYDSYSKTNQGEYDKSQMLAMVAAMDVRPAYRTNWDLGQNTNFEAGVIYMAQMNPKEPACFTMLGIAAWRQRNYHLAASACEKAIALGSAQTDVLKARVAGLNEYIAHSDRNGGGFKHMVVGAFSILLIYCVYAIIRDRRLYKRAAMIKN